MQPLPNPPWYRRWSVILAGVIVLAAFAALLGWRGLQQVASPSPTTTTVTTNLAPGTSRTPATQPAPSTSRETPNVLWRAEGSDTHRSRLFRAPERWRIIWSFDCSNFIGGQGNFKITGEGAFTGVEVQAYDDEAEGSKPVRGGGFGRLVITSVCERWEVQAVRA